MSDARRIYFGKMEFFDKLCVAMSEVSGTKHQEKRVYAEALKIITALRKPQKTNSLEKKANAYFDNIIKKFVEEIPSISDTERKIFMFCVYGMSDPAIAFLLETTVATIYSRKADIKRKIRNAPINEEKKTYFLSYIARPKKTT